MRQTIRMLDELRLPLDNVWIIAVQTVSDQQIQHLFQKILYKEPAAIWNRLDWNALTLEEKKEIHLQWFDSFMPTLHSYQGGGIILGLLDTFRSDVSHLQKAVALAAKYEIEQIRLVDTAGTCIPHQLETYVATLVKNYPSISFLWALS